MSKIDEIRGEMVKAMKAKDKARKDVLSLLLMPKVKGKADGKLVNQVLGSMMA